MTRKFPHTCSNPVWTDDAYLQQIIVIIVIIVASTRMTTDPASGACPAVECDHSRVAPVPASASPGQMVSLLHDQTVFGWSLGKGSDYHLVVVEKLAFTRLRLQVRLL